ncbi:sensor histidine kinase [Sphingobacterium kitahiroshimense]|uniref:histidine kinase n=2 Tax=Sphingobacterium TaxID=28453 RepID=A0ABV0BU87_9SPHI
MANTLSVYVKNILYRLSNVGVDPEMSYVESQYTKLINILNWIGMCCMLSYAIVNFGNERYFLSFLNLLNVCDATTVLILNKYRKYLSARLVMVISRLIIYTVAGLYFHNGGEYFLVALLITTSLMIDNKWIRFSLCFLIFIACVAVILFPQPPLLGSPVPPEQAYANMIVGILLIVGVVSFFKSIQSTYQQEIEKQRQALFSLNKDKEKMFSILAHDIRSPMVTLENLLQMFHEDLLTHNERIETIGLLKDQVSQLGSVMDNLLRWSVRGMQGIQSIKVTFLLRPLVLELFHFFDFLVRQKQLTVDINIPESMSLFADYDQTAVILRNLLSNAIKFSEVCGRVKVFADVKGNMIDIFIKDEGMGMDDRRINMLFTSSQLSTKGTIGERGFGLGLILCAEFTRLNEGTIRVESKLNKGSVFAVSLPKNS